MSRVRAGLVLGVGAAAAIAGGVLIAGAIHGAFTEHPEIAVPQSETGRAEAARVAATPGQEARLVVDLEVATDSVQEVVEAGRVTYRGRYRFPLDYRVSAADGALLAAAESAVDWRRDGTALPAGPRQAALTERDARIDADGGTLGVRAVFPTFEVPADGMVALSVELGRDSLYGARARRVRFVLEHGLRSRAVDAALGAFLLVGGWVAAVVGLVMLLAGPLAGHAPAVVVSGPEADRVRRLAMCCHLAGLLGYLIPFGNVLGPLVVWLLTRERHPYVDEQGREALNFQLTILVYGLLAFALLLVLVGLLMIPVILVFQLVMVVTAAVRANDGEAWRYPLTIRFVR